MTRPETSSKGRVLAIAGSDSSGGAGLQADIKTVTMLGGFAMTAVTALTAQNTLGVHGIWPTPPDGLVRQIEVVLGDIGADAIKTGMLASTAQIERTGECLDIWARETPRIIDPVLVATSGDQLVDEASLGALLSIMVPGATLVTPNAQEAEQLTGKVVETVDGQRRAAEALLELGAKGALVKGGHVSGPVITDVLQTEYGEWLMEAPRIETVHTHGTGCSLASAIATGLALAVPLEVAVKEASDYVHNAIKTAPGLGSGHGPLGHGWPLQQSQ